MKHNGLKLVLFYFGLVLTRRSSILSFQRACTAKELAELSWGKQHAGDKASEKSRLESTESSRLGESSDNVTLAGLVWGSLSAFSFSISEIRSGAAVPCVSTMLTQQL